MLTSTSCTNQTAITIIRYKVPFTFRFSARPFPPKKPANAANISRPSALSPQRPAVPALRGRGRRRRAGRRRGGPGEQDKGRRPPSLPEEHCQRQGPLESHQELPLRHQQEEINKKQ